MMMMDTDQKQGNGTHLCGLLLGTPLQICALCQEFPLLVVRCGTKHSLCLVNSFIIRSAGKAAPPITQCSPQEPGGDTKP